jgi:hypothetical protein
MRKIIASCQNRKRARLAFSLAVDGHNQRVELRIERLSGVGDYYQYKLGSVTQLRKGSSGSCYFTLVHKTNTAHPLSGVTRTKESYTCWRFHNLPPKVRQVLSTGRLTLHEEGFDASTATLTYLT